MNHHSPQPQSPHQTKEPTTLYEILGMGSEKRSHKFLAQSAIFELEKHSENRNIRNILLRGICEHSLGAAPISETNLSEEQRVHTIIHWLESSAKYAGIYAKENPSPNDSFASDMLKTMANTQIFLKRTPEERIKILGSFCNEAPKDHLSYKTATTLIGLQHINALTHHLGCLSSTVPASLLSGGVLKLLKNGVTALGEAVTRGLN